MIGKTKKLLPLFLAMALALTACGGTSSGNTASADSAQTADSAEAARLAEEAEKAKKEAEEKAAAEASRAAAEASRKAEEEAKAAAEALEKELEEYGIERVEDGILAEIAAACAAEDFEKICELIESEPYADLTADMENSGQERHIVQTKDGRIGVYYMDGWIYGYYVYFGDFKGDQREGNGMLFGGDYYMSFDTPYYYLVKGEWKNDLPNGQVETLTHMEAGDEFQSAGGVIDGLYDGVWSVNYTPVEGKGSSYEETYHNGHLLLEGWEEFLVYDNVADLEKALQEKAGHSTMTDGKGYYYLEDTDYIIMDDELERYATVHTIHGFERKN